MRKVSHTALATALLSALGLLAGCGGKAIEPPPLSDSTKPTSSPTGPPTLPAEAQGTDAKAAEAFVRFWIKTLNFAAATGETDQLRAISTSQCNSCASVMSFIDHTYEKGGSLKGDGWSVASLRSSSVGHVHTEIAMAKQTVVPSMGASPSTSAGSDKTTVNFVLEPNQGSWKVSVLEVPR